MATYRVSVGKQEYVVDVTREEVLVNGKPIDASLTPINEGGLYMLRRANRSRELHIHPQGNSAYGVMVNGRHLVAQVEKGNKVRRKVDTGCAGTLVAPMPGMVVNVLVKEGQHVNDGEPLVVLESMKMQMQLRSPFAGQVSKIAVQNKAQVEKGAFLIQIAGD